MASILKYRSEQELQDALNASVEQDKNVLALKAGYILTDGVTWGNSGGGGNNPAYQSMLDRAEANGSTKLPSPAADALYNNLFNSLDAIGATSKIKLCKLFITDGDEAMSLTDVVATNPQGTAQNAPLFVSKSGWDLSSGASSRINHGVSPDDMGIGVGTTNMTFLTIATLSGVFNMNPLGVNSNTSSGFTWSKGNTNEKTNLSWGVQIGLVQIDDTTPRDGLPFIYHVSDDTTKLPIYLDGNLLVDPTNLKSGNDNSPAVNLATGRNATRYDNHLYSVICAVENLGDANVLAFSNAFKTFYDGIKALP